MTQIVKLSLVASVLLATSVFADTLEEAFKASKVMGEIKAEYAYSNFFGKTSFDDVSVIGGSLNIVTGQYYGLNGTTFQTSHLPDIDSTGGVFKDDLEAQGSVLSEAYINYKISNTSLKAGRQYIYTPLISTSLDGKSSETLLKDSFEGYILTNTDIPNTTFVAGYVSKYQAKTDGMGSPGKFEKFQDGAYTMYVQNKSIENLIAQAQYLDENGLTSGTDKDVFYLQVDYTLGGHTLSGQYLSSTDKTQAIKFQDGQLWGLRATGGLGIGQLGYVVAYSSSINDGAIYTGAGAGTTDTLFTAMPVNGGAVAARGNTNTIVGGLIVPIAGVTMIGYAGQSSCSDNIGPFGGDFKAIGAVAIYPYNKNFSIKANYEHVSADNVFEDTEVARVYLSYKF
ncbi:MAG: hypothetical protein J0647_07465 [Campylobacteraceae bacterium]|nr:hypothetical protein [Campylobacteraceae bacterium]